METVSPGAGRSDAERAQSMDQCKPSSAPTNSAGFLLIFSPRGQSLRAHLHHETKRARGVGLAGAEGITRALRHARRRSPTRGTQHIGPLKTESVSDYRRKNALPTLNFHHTSPTLGTQSPFLVLSPLEDREDPSLPPAKTASSRADSLTVKALEVSPRSHPTCIA